MIFSKGLSRLFGFIAALKFPQFIQTMINEKYVKYFNIDMDEFKDACEYESLNALFCRSLEKKRKLHEGFISPSDGKILECGHTFLAHNSPFAFSIKGHSYSIEELLRGNCKACELSKDLTYINIYLSPKDYHRYHSPCDMQILSASYIRGTLYSVNERALAHISNLYAKNERLSLKCQNEGGIFWLVFIGAQNVGKMCFNFDLSIQTNASNSSNFTRNYQNLMMQKGEELGHFQLGSTIVIILQKAFLTVKPGQSIKFGQTIAH